MNEDLGLAMAWGQGMAITAGMDPAVLAGPYTRQFTQNFLRTDSSDKVLGSRTFTTTGFRDTPFAGKPARRPLEARSRRPGPQP